VRRLLFLTASLMVGLIILDPARAQQSDEDRARRWFEEHDRDQDGFFTIEEVMRYETKLFQRTDHEARGRLREDEFCAGIPASNTIDLERCHRRFAHIDSNGDGTVTLEEIEEFYRLILQTADENGDGKVSLEEFLAVSQE